jgi:plasmid stabilization system protein ParE
MPKQIIWSPLAENDFGNILEYLNQKWGEKVAYQFIEITSTFSGRFQLSRNCSRLLTKK